MHAGLPWFAPGRLSARSLNIRLTEYSGFSKLEFVGRLYKDMPFPIEAVLMDLSPAADINPGV